MQLREPAICCGVTSLVWDKTKHVFICPCGIMVININGRPRQKQFRGFCFGQKETEHETKKENKTRPV
jgi:hypothetical protein